MSDQSSIEELNSAIKNENPFDGRYVVKSQQIWGEEFPDLSSLHAHVSDTVVDLINKVNKQKLSTVGVTILAGKGAGKSHVLSRIRHHIQMTKSGLFIYLCEYGNLNHIKYQFLQGLASSLRKRGSQGVMQCQEIATLLVNKSFNKNLSSLQLISQFPKVLSKNSKIVTQLTEKILPSLNISNPHILQAFIWTLSPVHAPFAINWLAGRELAQVQSDVLGLPSMSREDREVSAFTMVCEILDLISQHVTPIICFDELDGSEMGDEENPLISGYTRAQVVASFAKDLYNNLQKGLIITSMYEQTLKTQVRLLPRAEAIEDRIAQKVLNLNPLKSEEAVELVAGWLEDFYARYGLTPPHKVYPFDENQLREIGTGATVREILRWCADNFGTNIDIGEKIERIYREIEETVGESIEDLFEDNEKIASAIAFGIQYLKGQTIENLVIEDIDRDIVPKSENRGTINFRVIGKENGNDVKLGVAIIQNSHGRSFSTALRRLTQYETFNLTRGCLVRSKSVKESWSGYEDLQTLLNGLGGEWVLLKEEELKPLIALRTLFKELENYGFQKEHFYQFVDQNRLLVDNPLIREILSDPSGQAPAEAIDEDSTIEILDDVDETSSDSISDLDEIDASSEIELQFNTSLLSQTQLSTLELYQQGLGIDDITQQRSLSRSTIVRHFVDMFEINQPIDLDRLVPLEKQSQIRRAIEEVENPSSLRSIRALLDDGFTYDDIQLVRAKWYLEKRLQKQHA